MENPTNRVEHKVAWVLIGLAVIGLIFFGYRVLNGDMKARIPVNIGVKTFNASIARTEAERQQGLGGTLELTDSQALLMVFEKDDKWKIWMKDMNYPIDIVWIGVDKRVVDTAQHAQPDSYPDKLYVPRQDARYVLELPDGAIQKYSIKRGSVVQFDVTKVQ